MLMQVPLTPPSQAEVQAAWHAYVTAKEQADATLGARGVRAAMADAVAAGTAWAVFLCLFERYQPRGRRLHVIAGGRR